MRLALFDDGHPAVAGSRNALAAVLHRNQRFEEALEIHRASHASFAARVGTDHPDTLMIAVNLGFVLRDLKRYQEWRDLLAETAPRLEAHHGPSHSITIWAMTQFARAEQANGDLARAVEIGRRTVERATAGLGNHMRTAQALLGLGRIEAARGEEAACFAAFDEALAMMVELFGVGSLNTCRARCSHVDELVRFGRLDAAVTALDGIDADVQALGSAGESVRDRVARLRDTIAAQRR